MKSDEELKKSFKVFVDENGIINLIMLKFEAGEEDNVRETELIRDDLLEIFNKNPEKNYNIFTDMSGLINVKNATFIPLQTRRISAQIMNHRQLKKAAFSASNLVQRTAVNLIIEIVGKGERIRGFPDKEKALKWLKEP